MKITVCIGSSCHLKGSRQIVEKLQELIADKNLQDKVDLGGTFCMGDCTNGVNVKIGESKFSLSPKDTEAFFENEVLNQL
ncbi:MAG: (2Fe-2S) ferredoxin domain-containing protein [Clostridiales bacterium]|jgi:NADH:ubiquinone oxidoreductase subunit E|nr:(2Fe-2S) ferredoxin domain-containing protein [Clostridia bacterium]NLH58275.1 (2Fe-2S) ferredoxin domain-containing protein [Clostridiales bacterium]